MGCSSSVCEEEGQDPSNMHRLPTIEQGYDKRIGIPYRGLMICLIN